MLLTIPLGFAPPSVLPSAQGSARAATIVCQQTTSSGANPADVVGPNAPRESYAPASMGKEYVNQPRKPLSEYVGASVEFCAYPGAPDAPVPWDPMRFSELYKVSGNNPDVAWLREAELKHGRMSMLAITGVMVQSAGVHLPGNADISFANSDWASAPTTLPAAAWVQVLAFIGLCEGQTSVGLFDLWNGVTDKREPGDLGFGSQFLSKDPVAADKMRLKELKNARLAMLAIMGVAFNHVIPGALPSGNSRPAPLMALLSGLGRTRKPFPASNGRSSLWPCRLHTSPSMCGLLTIAAQALSRAASTTKQPEPDAFLGSRERHRQNWCFTAV